MKKYKLPDYCSVDDSIFHFSLFIIMMKEIIKILSKDEIVGLHTIGNPDDLYCGKIIKYAWIKIFEIYFYFVILFILF